jgi:hypothetical protein
VACYLKVERHLDPVAQKRRVLSLALGGDIFNRQGRLLVPFLIRSSYPREKYEFKSLVIEKSSKKKTDFQHVHFFKRHAIEVFLNLFFLNKARDFFFILLNCRFFTD